MGGWYFDVLIEFLIRSVVRWAKSWRSHHWPVVEAKLAGVTVLPYTGGCEKTQLVYRYRFEGQYYGGYIEKPFLSRTSAEEYAKEFKAENMLPIRVRPDTPEISFLRDEDLFANPADAT